MLIPLFEEDFMHNVIVLLTCILMNDPGLDLFAMVHFWQILVDFFNYQIFGLKNSFIYGIEEFDEHKNIARSIE